MTCSWWLQAWALLACGLAGPQDTGTLLGCLPLGSYLACPRSRGLERGHKRPDGSPFAEGHISPSPFR
eukprot:3071517-Heterocapsa_arctica.AAC.1